MLVIHWSQARYGSLKIKGRKRPGLNAMTYSSMENWADYWCVGRCVHFIILPACSYSSLFIRAVDYDFQLFHGYISRSIYYFYQQVCTYSEHHELEVCGVWLTDGCICNAWLYWSEFDIQMSLASVFVFRNVFFLDVGFYISVSIHILLPFR